MNEKNDKAGGISASEKLKNKKQQETAARVFRQIADQHEQWMFDFPDLRAQIKELAKLQKAILEEAEGQVQRAPNNKIFETELEYELTVLQRLVQLSKNAESLSIRLKNWDMHAKDIHLRLQAGEIIPDLSMQLRELKEAPEKLGYRAQYDNLVKGFNQVS